MRYVSATTPKGNSSYSYEGQDEADASAAKLDVNGCTGCTDCTGCTGCTDCRYCTDCTDCTGCTDCTDCTGCTDCRYCTGCMGCRYCTGCTGCTDCRYCRYCTGCTGCTDCTGEVIQAGRPNKWVCYGWLKDDRLMIHCGCRKLRLSEALAYWADKPDRREALAYWADKPDRREVLAACNYIAEVAKLRGWSL